MASSLVVQAIEQSKDIPDFKGQALNVCLGLLPTVAESCRSEGAMSEFFSILTHSIGEDKDNVKHSQRLVEVLQLCASRAFDNRTTFYNILRTHYNLFGFPLDQDMFSRQNVGGSGAADSKDKGSPVTKTGSKLPVNFTGKNMDATTEAKGGKVRFNQIHKKDLWVTIDLGSTCLLQEINFMFKTDYNSTPSTITIDTWVEQNATPKRLFSKEVAIYSLADEKPNYFSGALNRSCRYLKVVIDPHHPSSYEGANMHLHIYGIPSYLTLGGNTQNVLAQLKPLLTAEEEKLFKATADFANARRSLTNVIEEINLNDAADIMRHKQEVTTAYEECVKLQLEEHKLKRKVARLKEMKSSLE